MATNGPSDALLRRILAAIAAEPSEARVRALVEEARAEAEQEIKALLKQALKAGMLRQAADLLEGGGEDAGKKLAGPSSQAEVAETAEELPAAAHEEPVQGGAGEEEAARGCYVYGFTRGSVAGGHASAAAIDPRYPVGEVCEGELKAIVSSVEIQAFSRAAMERHLQEPQWVEARVRAHDAVVKQAMAGGAVIPCRFCTILRGPQEVRRLLTEHREQITATLDLLAGKQEWGVKLYHSGQGGGRLAAGDPESTGKAYLRRKGDEVRTQQEEAGLARERATAVFEKLAALAAEATLLPSRNGKGGELGRRLLLNGAFLLADEAVQAFERAARELGGADEGIEVELTGPWPPYNFVHLDLAPREVS